MHIDVIYKDADFVAVNKPAGLLMHKTPQQKSDLPDETLAAWLVKHYPAVKSVGDDPAWRPGIVHRLDKETSGVVVVPLTQAYFSYMKGLFQDHGVHKTYYAIVAGTPKNASGTIDKPIGIKAGTTKRSVHGTKMVKEAVTEYRTLASFEKEGEQYSLLEVRPLTGRTHQIRVHCAFLGHPVVGDKLYGGKRNAHKAPRHMLHCFSMEFAARPGERVALEAPLPEDFLAFMGEASQALTK
jgi:23S rRNA pseudouridine1911/1915/1917 synthase